MVEAQQCKSTEVRCQKGSSYKRRRKGDFKVHGFSSINYTWCYKFFKLFNTIVIFLIFSSKDSNCRIPEVPEVEKEEQEVADTEKLWCQCQEPEYGYISIIYYTAARLFSLLCSLVYYLSITFFSLRFMIKCDEQAPRCHIWYHGCLRQN